MKTNRTILHVSLPLCLLCTVWFLTILTACSRELSCLELVQEVVIPEIHQNLSGLTWNPETATLFAITNEPTLVFELNTQGHVLRKIALHGFKDTEGITHLTGTLFAVIEERRDSVCVIDIPAQATSIAYAAASCLQWETTHTSNKGFEGLSYDPGTRTIFAMREGKPFLCLAIPLDKRDTPGQPRKITLPSLPVRDVASIIRDPDGSMWILSEASARILHVGADAQIQKTYRLPAGRHDIQAEGIARTPDGRLFVVGEPNIFVEYVEKEHCAN